MKNIIKGLLALVCLASIQTASCEVTLGKVTNNTNQTVVFALGSRVIKLKAGEAANLKSPVPMSQSNPALSAILGRDITVGTFYIIIPIEPQIEPLKFTFARMAESRQDGTIMLSNVASLQRGVGANIETIASWNGPKPETIRQGEQDDYRVDITLDGQNLHDSSLEVTTIIR